MTGEIIGSSEMIRGVARLFSMKYTPYSTFSSAVEKALSSKCDYVHLHTKETDQAGHTKDPFAKVKSTGSSGPLTFSSVDLC